MRVSCVFKILSLRLNIYVSGLIFQSAPVTHSHMKKVVSHLDNGKGKKGDEIHTTKHPEAAVKNACD